MPHRYKLDSKEVDSLKVLNGEWPENGAAGSRVLKGNEDTGNPNVKRDQVRLIFFFFNYLEDNLNEDLVLLTINCTASSSIY